MNTVSLIGRLVESPELKYTPNGKAVCNFRIAVNNAGQFISEKEGFQAGFFEVVVWGNQAENFVNYCDKGREVGVQGRLSQRTYEAQDGGRRYITEVIAERIDFLREPANNSQNGNSGNNQSNGNNNRSNGNNRGNSNKGNNRSNNR